MMEVYTGQHVDGRGFTAYAEFNEEEQVWRVYECVPGHTPEKFGEWEDIERVKNAWRQENGLGWRWRSSERV